MNSSAASRNNILNRLQQTSRIHKKIPEILPYMNHKSFDEGKRWSVKEK